MEWFIIGRDMHVLCNPSTDIPDSLPIDDSGDSMGQEIALANNVATGIYDFITDPDHPDSVHITEGNYIAFIDKYSKHRLYTMMTIEGDTDWTVHCEDVGLDLLNEDTAVWDLTGNPEPIAKTLGRVLDDTGWEIGINEIPDRSRATKYESLTDTQLARVGMICNTFECEADFEIEMQGSKVVKQVVNIYKELGEDRVQQRFIDNINLIALRRSGSIEDLCTCMRCFGKEDEETGEKLTIASIVYDDGRYFTTQGDTRIYDREARDKWSRYRAYYYDGDTASGGYINGTFEYDTDSAQELFNRGLSNLQSRNDVKVSYEASLYDLEADIGDTVQIADNRHNEKIYLSARVQSVRNHYTVKGEDTGVLANYQILVSNPTAALTDMLEELKSQIVTIEDSEVRYQVGISGTETPTGEWLDYIPDTDSGQYLWTQIIIDYSNNTSTQAYSVSKDGADGTDGKDGADGTDGRGVSNITEYYAASTSNTTAPTSWSTTVPTLTATNKYLWNYESMLMSDGTTVTTTKRVIGVYGDTGKGISTVVNYYLTTSASTGVTTSTSGWSTTPTATSEAVRYLWNYEKITYSDGTTTNTTPCIIGTHGVAGADGEDGRGIASTAITYQTSSSGTTVPTGTWQSVIPATPLGYYMWTRTIITYTDGTTSTGYSVSRNGVDGGDGIIISATAPESPVVNQLWQTASGQPIQRWDGSKWVLHYISVENLDVETLSAIKAYLGDVQSGTITNMYNGNLSIILGDHQLQFYDWTAANSQAGYISSQNVGGTTSASELLINGTYGVSIAIGGTTIATFGSDDMELGGVGVLSQFDTINDRLNTIPQFISGSAVKTASSSSVAMFTLAQLQTMFGASTAGTNNFTAVFTNGDGNAADTHIDGSTWVGSSLYAVFAASRSGTIRINYTIIYNPTLYQTS